MVDDKIGNEKQSTLSAGHFDRHGHGDAPVQYECITWCSMPRATPEVTGRCHRESTHSKITQSDMPTPVDSYISMWKRAWVDMLAPKNNRDMIYQTN